MIWRTFERSEKVGWRLQVETSKSKFIEAMQWLVVIFKGVKRPQGAFTLFYRGALAKLSFKKDHFSIGFMADKDVRDLERSLTQVEYSKESYRQAVHKFRQLGRGDLASDLENYARGHRNEFVAQRDQIQLQQEMYAQYKRESTNYFLIALGLIPLGVPIMAASTHILQNIEEQPNSSLAITIGAIGVGIFAIGSLVSLGVGLYVSRDWLTSSRSERDCANEEKILKARIEEYTLSS